MSALYYLPPELWLKLKEKVSILGPNYLLQHPRQHLHQRLHQHLHHRHHLRHLLLPHRSPLEELRPRLVLLEVVVRSLENLQLKYLVLLIYFSPLSLSFSLCLYFCVIVWFWMCSVVCLRGRHIRKPGLSVVFPCERVCVVLPWPPAAPPGGGP